MSALIEHIRSLYWPTLTVLWPSVLAAVALAVAGGVLGVFVILRREALLALAMPQIVTLGAAVGVRFEWWHASPDWASLGTLLPAMGTVGVALTLLAWSRRRDTGNLLLPALYVAGASLSILLIANAGAHLAEVQKLFTGIDVAVGATQARIVAVVLTAIGITAALLWRRWLLLAQAPAAAELARLRPGMWNALFLGLLAAALVLATNTVGTVMVVSLLFLPAGTVLPWATRIPLAVAAAVAVALVSVAAGFVLAVEMEWPFSHSVGGAGFALFLLSWAMAQVASRR